MITYDAFGMPVKRTGTPPTKSLFAGGFGYQDDNNGLLLLGHRYYDPAQGRFLTQDPIGSGRNWWNYCDNDPLNAIDPFGLFALQEQSLKGLLGAARAESGIKELPMDCEDWILLHAYPGEWSNGMAHEVPSKLKKRRDWIQVPNNGNLLPGDLIISGRGRGGHGHIRIVGDEPGEPKLGYDKKLHPTIEMDDASQGKRKGTKHYITTGIPFRDSSGRKTTIWRPLDKWFPF